MCIHFCAYRKPSIILFDWRVHSIIVIIISIAADLRFHSSFQPLIMRCMYNIQNFSLSLFFHIHIPAASHIYTYRRSNSLSLSIYPHILYCAFYFDEMNEWKEREERERMGSQPKNKIKSIIIMCPSIQTGLIEETTLFSIIYTHSS